MNALIKRVLCLSLIMAMLFCSAAWAKEVTISGSGISRDEAVRDALRLAVEQSVGTLVDSQTIVRNNKVVIDEIYSQAQGFVQEYHIMSESITSGSYVVQVKVQIDTEPNSALYSRLQQLKLISVMLRDPRIAVIIPEIQQSGTLSSPAGAAAVIGQLKNAGFKYVLDSSQLQQVRQQQILRAMADNDYQGAKGIAAEENLDFVVVGEAASQLVGDLYGSGIKSSRASLTVKVLKADTAEVIAAQSFTASGADVTEVTAAKKALAACGDKAGEYLVKKLMDYASNPDKPLTIVIKRASFNKLADIQKTLQQASGVRKVYLRSYSGGVAQIDVTYAGAAQSLADVLQHTDGISMEITGISNSSIEAVLQ